MTERDWARATAAAADLAANARGWRDALKGVRKLRAGAFLDAKSYYSDLLAHDEYSPALSIYARYRRIDARLRLGELEESEREVQLLLRALDRFPEDFVPTLDAEVLASAGMLALRAGTYSVASTYLERSEGRYAQLLSGGANTDDVASLGFARTYKRLAQVALFAGETTDAITSCFAAESYLARAPASPSRDFWLRRVRELQGWAYSRRGNWNDIRNAVALHEETQRACEAAGDAYGAVLGNLYIGDDLRRGLQADAARACPAEHEHGPADRRRCLREAIREHTVDLDLAAQAYSRALHGMRGAQDRLMEGRCLTSMATILRFRGALAAGRADAEALCDRAEECLDLAIEIDERIGQGRRIPAIHAAYAAIESDRAEWDPGRLARAARHVEQALAEFERPRVTWSDQAAQQLQEHLRRDGERLEREIDQTAHVAPVLAGIRESSSPYGPESKWRDLNAELANLLSLFVTQHGERRVATSIADEDWLDTILQVEKQPGTRRLALNTLSASLSSYLPAGALPETADLYRRRFVAFTGAVAAARDGTTDVRAPTINRDLCHQQTVERELATDGLRRLTLDQVEHARRCMEQEPPGYELTASPFELPIGFMVKGEHVLIEVPVTADRRFLVNGDAALPEDAVLCFALRNDALARKVAARFDDLVRIATRGRSEPAYTLGWLSELSRETAGPRKVGRPSGI